MPTGIKENLIGQKISMLSIIERHIIKKKVFYLCLCECGKTKLMRQESIKRYKSCGCLHKLKVSKPQGERDLTAAKAAYNNYVYRDKERGLDIDLTFEKFLQFSLRDCYYCGQKPDNVSRTKSGGIFIYNGLDRLDSRLGYTESNVVTSCHTCNTIKMAMTRESFDDWIIRAYNRLLQRKEINV